MKLTHTLGFIVALTATSATMAGGYPMPASDSGLITVPPLHSAQINVINLDPESSCSVELSFIDVNGNTFPNVPDTLPLAPGSSVSQPVVFATGGVVRAHIDYTPQINLNLTHGVRDLLAGCYHLVPTLEILAPNGSHDAVITTFVGAPSLAKSSPPARVTLCHKPGTPAQKTMVLPVSAIKGHLGHGDHLGPCQ